MSENSNLQRNLEMLAQIKLKNPTTTHVYVKRTDKDGLTVDIPIEQAEFTLRNHVGWELVGGNKQMDDAVEALFKEPELEVLPEPELEVPPRPSEMSQNGGSSGPLQTGMDVDAPGSAGGHSMTGDEQPEPSAETPTPPASPAKKRTKRSTNTNVKRRRRA